MRSLTPNIAPKGLSQTFQDCQNANAAYICENEGNARLISENLIKYNPCQEHQKQLKP